MSQKKLAALSRISLSTIKEIEKHEEYRERAEGTLENISSALGLEPSYLDDVLAGRKPEYPAVKPETEPTLGSLKDILVEFSEKLDAIEEHVGNIDASLASLAKRPDIHYPISTINVSTGLESPGLESPGLESPGSGVDAPTSQSAEDAELPIWRSAIDQAAMEQRTEDALPGRCSCRNCRKTPRIGFMIAKRFFLT
jgi:transcriptional regulator with XRE-family HTH domain